MLETLAEIQRELAIIRRNQPRAARYSSGSGRVSDELLNAVIRLRRDMPTVDIKDNDEIANALLKHNPEALKPYASRPDFAAAMQALRDYTNVGSA